jgi:hypothetical protein
MNLISESVIDQYLDRYENESNFLQDLSQLTNEQADLMAFISQENNSLLTQHELALLEYLTVVIYFSGKRVMDSIKINGNDLEKAEEKNWEIFNEHPSKNFTKKLDIFFENYQQEDLLALVEDSIQADEEEMVTPIGKEIIFVACKSIIDVING